VSAVTFPSLISVICLWSFAFRWWRRTPLLALFQVREVRVSQFELFLIYFWACWMFVWINHYLWCVGYFVWLVCLENISAAGEYRARTGNLAQASRTRLSESGGGSPNFLRELSPKRVACFLARPCLAQARWARLSELACLLMPALSNSRLGEVEFAWARVLLA